MKIRDATLCLLLRDKQVLLGLKKAGLGAGKVTGFGGKVEPGETMVQAAAREMGEETGVRVREEDLQCVGHLTFLFPHQPDWSQAVHVFVARRWQGDPAEGQEMRPAWFAPDEIPYQRMWQDGPHWLPPILAGRRVRARFTFKADNETLDGWEMETWDGKLSHDTF